jgi:hypothetical protein
MIFTVLLSLWNRQIKQKWKNPMKILSSGLTLDFSKRTQENWNSELVHLLQDLRFSLRWLWRMVSSGMLRRGDLVRTDVSEEPGASFIRVTRIGELGTTQAATSNRRKLSLWVRQSLHWADGPFRGHQDKRASTAHKTRSFRQVGRSWTHYRPGTSYSIPQCFHLRQENQMYGRHCQGGHWDWTPPLQYQQRGWLLSQ